MIVVDALAAWVRECVFCVNYSLALPGGWGGNVCEFLTSLTSEMDPEFLIHGRHRRGEREVELSEAAGVEENCRPCPAVRGAHSIEIEN